MNHQEEHQQHRKEREEANAAQKHHEHEEARRPGNIHPAWYLAVGLTLTLIATLTWMLLYPGSF